MQHFYSRVSAVSLTIFAMLFGAGNLMFPPKLGIEMGQHTWLGFFGFFLSGVVLPMLSLLTIVAFEGDYQKFFGRLGSPLGQIFIFICMLIIGPVVVMPRIVMLPYEMFRPFMPAAISPLIFAVLFSGIAFLATYRPGRLIDIVGKILSPLKILTLLIIVGVGLFSGAAPEPVSASAWALFGRAFTYGYLTLDVLGSIFFGAMIVHLLTKYVAADERLSMQDAMKVTAVSSVCAGLLLGSVYLGMTLLGAYHGQGLGMLNKGAIFGMIAFRVLGSMGAAFIAGSVFLACFTTNVALAAVVGEYVQGISRNRLSYPQAVAAVLAACTVVAQLGLEEIERFSEPLVINYFYPLIVVIMLCNLAYKLVDFKPIVAPVAITALILFVQKFFIYAWVISFLGMQLLCF